MLPSIQSSRVARHLYHKSSSKREPMCSMPNTAKNIWPNSNSWFYTPHGAGGWRVFLPLCIQSSSWVKQTAKSLLWGVPSSPELCYQSSDTLAGSHNGMPLLHVCSCARAIPLFVFHSHTSATSHFNNKLTLPECVSGWELAASDWLWHAEHHICLFYPQICQHHFVTLKIIFKKQDMQFGLCIICNYS